MLRHHGVNFPIIAAGTGTAVEHCLETLSNTNSCLTKMEPYSADWPRQINHQHMCQGLFIPFDLHRCCLQ